MSDKSKEQEDTQKNPQIGSLGSDDGFELFAETHSAPSSQHVSDDVYHQQDSLFLSGMHQDGETSGVTMSNSFLQNASSSSLSTEEQVNPGNPVSTGFGEMQFFLGPEAAAESCSNSYHLKKLFVDKDIEHEPQEEYTSGGYCPIEIRRILNKEFVIIKKLGCGGYSTVWLAWHMETQECVALKITKSAERAKEMAEKELNFLEVCTIANPNAMGANNIVRILSSFSHTSENGIHLVMAFELCGPSLHNVLHQSNQRSIHMEQVRSISRQLLEAVSFLHDECGIIHSDIKPANLMTAISIEDVLSMAYDSFTTSFDMDFTHPDCDINIILSDLGVSCWANEPRCPLLQTCEYRAPEVFLKANAGTSADMWSVGCVAFELVTGTRLFSCNDSKNVIDEATHHLRQISEIIGTIPFAPYRSEQNTEFLQNFFKTDGRFISEMRFDPSRLLNKIRGYRNMAPEDAELCAQFISSCLKLDPKERPTAKQALNHQFLLPFGGKSPSRFEREDTSDDFYLHGPQNFSDTNLLSVTPLPNGPTSPIQHSDVSGPEAETGSGSGSSIVTVVESSVYKLKKLSLAPSTSQVEHSTDPETPSP
ncbi:hypothetical protein CAEBREN_05561 [Caenorhabditis brenneri]|uniref:non-specific serine/threonine protein kinase n=1 Tax=Caenorhabditis brenneri TaxID=135651 RepID=G0MH97_CAEBE|nr:hypothetical protein CAEBREN_05561 [Caenorhabditis brenneri]